jgi:YkoY family integral membrane protein
LFSQTFDLHDLFVILVLIVLEGVLSIDNALVLGLLARRLPESLRKKALTYGLVGAFAFRIIAIFFASWLLRSGWVKLLGGAYLVFLSGKHLLFKPKVVKSKLGADEDPGRAIDMGKGGARFWPTVASIELTDIAFAIDSILAAVALVAENAEPVKGKLHPKLWVIVTGGMLGVLLMRVAASMFIRLLDRFPRFETAAYLLVLVIGAKLIADWGFNVPGQKPVLDFHSPGSAMFWVFWGLMAGCFSVGFIGHKKVERV